MTLRQQLCEFHIHEMTPVDSVIGVHSMAEVFQEIEAILSSNEREHIANTLTFVRDAGLYRHPHREAFRQFLQSAQIWETLRDLLRAPDCSVRYNAIYTIGKLTERNRSCLLSEAFPFYLENDPINLPRLLMELLWLTNEWDWSLVEQVASSKEYLLRWSLCQILDDTGDSLETRGRFLEILAGLKSDAHPLVAAEGNFRYERVKVKLGPRLPKVEWRDEVKRIAGLRPRLLFEATTMQFMGGRSDYTLDELDSFVASLLMVDH